MKILILYYSTYGHMRQMALAAAEGARKVDGVEVDIKQIPETLSDEVIDKMNATESKKAMTEAVASVDDLSEYDGFIFGVPTRFGNMPAQFKTFWDATGGLWSKGALVGKVAGVMSSSATQHGGQESTLLTTQVLLLHHGMIIAGLPYSFQGQTRIDEITGGSPYGASTIAGGDGSRMPSENELAGASFQGEYIAGIIKRMNS